MARGSRALALVLVAAAAACTDAPTPAAPELAEPALARGEPPRIQETDRTNTPWRRMSVPELRRAVEQADGRVFIGFREPGAAAGVDNRGRVLVRDETVRAAKAQMRALGIDVEWEYSLIPAVVARMPAALTERLRSHPLVEYVEPIFPGEWHQQTTPWNITRVQAPLAWPYSSGSGVKLLIIDSGVYWGHRDLNPSVAWRCVNGSLPVGDQIGHGTHVAGIAAALNNSVDVVGVAPNVSLWSANIEVNGRPDPAEAACSVNLGRANGIFAMNMSFEILPYTPLTDQISGAYWQDGIFFAASAGNDYCAPVTYPANLGEVVAVAATTSSNTRASFSNCGWNLELSAPGQSILSTALPTGYSCASGGLTAYCDGTSMASPHVAAAAAVLKSYNPGWSNVDVRNRLRNTALPLGSGYYFGYGLVQVRDALL